MIPAYQFPSLNGENVAKRRVMQKAKKGFETEEQRAIKSGQIDDSIKSVFEAILANLRLQLSTVTTADALTLTIVGDLDADVKSFLIATLAKLAGLSTQLTILIEKLTEAIRDAGKTTIDLSKIVALMNEVDRRYGTWGTELQEGTGLRQHFNDLLNSFEGANDEDSQDTGVGYPIQIDGLLEIWEVSHGNNRDAIDRLQRNEYRTDLESIYIPSKTKNINRLRDIAEGERRTVTRDEYKLLLDMRKRGLVRGDDFTDAVSVISGANSSIFSGSNGNWGESSSEEEGSEEESSDEGDSDDESGTTRTYTKRLREMRRRRLGGDDGEFATFSNLVEASARRQRKGSSSSSTASSKSSSSGVNPFGDFKYVPRKEKPRYYGEVEGMGLSGGVRYSIPQQPKRVYNMASAFAIPIAYH